MLKMKNRKATLRRVYTVLLQAGKRHAARTTTKQNYKHWINFFFAFLESQNRKYL